MPLAITQVDAFTDRPFRGNPAAVCVLDRPADPAWMLAVAAEMNLAETAFLVPESADAYALRWFTPTVEVDLCGHATLASAHVLWEAGRLDRSRPAEFRTRSGLLTATLGPDGWITLDFPAQPIGPAAPALADALPRALDLDPAAIAAVRSGGADLLVEVASAAVVRAVRPDVNRVEAIPVRGVIVTARSDDPAYDFISRWFGPGTGVVEDPVTGSAHCALAPYWGEKLGRSRMTGYQASSRGGVVRVERLGDRVLLQGRAVTVLRGELAGVADPPAGWPHGRPIVP